MNKGLVISDLHMFSRRSVSAQHLEHLYEKIARSNALVLNGDIFDFRWTSLSSVEETVEKANLFVRNLIDRFPACQFYYVCGNHDSYPPFVEQLKKIAQDYSNFCFDTLGLRIGSNMFLHGDMVDATKQGKTLEKYRSFFHIGKKQGAMMNFLYDLLIMTGLHKIIIFVHKEPELAQIILDYLRKNTPLALEGIQNVYFGHTHVPFSNFLYQGINFHNTGSMIRKLDFNPCEFDF